MHRLKSSFEIALDFCIFKSFKDRSERMKTVKIKNSKRLPNKREWFKTEASFYPYRSKLKISNIWTKFYQNATNQKEKRYCTSDTDIVYYRSRFRLIIVQ